MMPSTLGTAMPPPAAPSPPPPAEAPVASATSITLPKAALGIADCKPGDVYQLEARGVVSASDGETVSFDIADVKAVAPAAEAEESGEDMFNAAAGGAAYSE